MINVLHISRTMGQGGAEKVVYQLCEDSEGIKSSVASCGGAVVSKLKEHKIDHITIPDIEQKNPIVIIKVFRTLNKYINDNDIEIIHTHHRMAAFYGRILQIVNPRLKHVYTSHNVFYGKKVLLKYALSKANIVACGMTVKNNLIDEYGIEPSRITVIYNSIKINEYNNHEANIPDFPSDVVKIGCIGRITKQKGFDIFVSALEKVVQAKHNVVGILIGDGEDKRKIEEMVKTLGIEKNVVFMGYQKNVLGLIKKLDFTVLPSRWEGFPLTPIEVFSQGKTIIVSDIKNNLEIVNDDENGLVFEKENADDLAVKIIKMIEHSEFKKKLEMQAQKDYVEKFEYSNFINQYSGLYKEIVKDLK